MNILLPAFLGNMPAFFRLCSWEWCIKGYHIFSQYSLSRGNNIFHLCWQFMHAFCSMSSVIHLTLEQHGFELWGSIYEGFFQ